MAGSVNKVCILGNVGKDPEVRNTQSGFKIVNLTIATSESWKDKATGERQERTEWHRVVIMNEAIGGVAERYVKKGSKIYVEGKLQTRKWTDQAGVDRYSTEIVLGMFNSQLVLLGDPRDGGDDASRAPAESRPAAGKTYGDARGYSGTRGDGMSGQAASSFDSGSHDNFDDEIPF